MESNYQQFRALVAWLNISELEAANELRISQSRLRKLLRGQRCPTSAEAKRITELSQRWPHGLIMIENWPSLANGAAE
jgi:hypothetical protein